MCCQSFFNSLLKIFFGQYFIVNMNKMTYIYTPYEVVLLETIIIFFSFGVCMLLFFYIHLNNQVKGSDLADDARGVVDSLRCGGFNVDVVSGARVVRVVVHGPRVDAGCGPGEQAPVEAVRLILGVPAPRCRRRLKVARL
jgi:hypothetical protein